MATAPSPRSRDPEATRAAILDAAETLFCERGFDGAATSAIAEAAGVTKSLLHHHYGSKEGLWHAVVERRFDAYARLQWALLERGEKDLSSFRDSIDALFAFLRDNPEFVRLHAWANAGGDASRKLPDGHPLTRRGVERLREIQAEGGLHSELDPAVVLAVYFCLIEHWFQARESLRERFGDALPDDDVYLHQMRALLLRGIRP
ncbi:MAG: TetR/AcrR family transcriptional regulator [Myxococcota bacterium]|nr:TetR/AcrR family transcriptional regulator [Myxococcota bacterium]